MPYAWQVKSKARGHESLTVGRIQQLEGTLTFCSMHKQGVPAAHKACPHSRPAKTSQQQSLTTAVLLALPMASAVDAALPLAQAVAVTAAGQGRSVNGAFAGSSHVRAAVHCC